MSRYGKYVIILGISTLSYLSASILRGQLRTKGIPDDLVLGLLFRLLIRHWGCLPCDRSLGIQLRSLLLVHSSVIFIGITVS